MEATVQKTRKPAAKKALQTGSVDVPLATPLEIEGTKVTALRMREPLVSDQEVTAEMSGSDTAREIQALANLCEVSADDIRRLTARDYRRLQTAYLGFLD